MAELSWYVIHVRPVVRDTHGNARLRYAEFSPDATKRSNVLPPSWLTAAVMRDVAPLEMLVYVTSSVPCGVTVIHGLSSDASAGSLTRTVGPKLVSPGAARAT